MKTRANTDIRELNRFYQSMYNSAFDHVWFPVEILTKKKFKTKQQIDRYFFDCEDYCGVRKVSGGLQVNFPIYKLDYLVGLDAVIEHMILDDE